MPKRFWVNCGNTIIDSRSLCRNFDDTFSCPYWGPRCQFSFETTETNNLRSSNRPTTNGRPYFLWWEWLLEWRDQQTKRRNMRLSCGLGWRALRNTWNHQRVSTRYPDNKRFPQFLRESLLEFSMLRAWSKQGAFSSRFFWLGSVKLKSPIRRRGVGRILKKGRKCIQKKWSRMTTAEAWWYIVFPKQLGGT